MGGTPSDNEEPFGKLFWWVGPQVKRSPFKNILTTILMGAAIMMFEPHLPLLMVQGLRRPCHPSLFFRQFFLGLDFPWFVNHHILKSSQKSQNIPGTLPSSKRGMARPSGPLRHWTTSCHKTLPRRTFVPKLAPRLALPKLGSLLGKNRPSWPTDGRGQTNLGGRPPAHVLLATVGIFGRHDLDIDGNDGTSVWHWWFPTSSWDIYRWK